MNELKREDFNNVILEGKTLLLYFYLPNHAPSIIGFASVQEVDDMLGKNFTVYKINFSEEPEISDALGVTSDGLPEAICIKNKKVYKRMIGPIFSNQILDLLK